MAEAVNEKHGVESNLHAISEIITENGAVRNSAFKIIRIVPTSSVVIASTVYV